MRRIWEEELGGNEKENNAVEGLPADAWPGAWQSIIHGFVLGMPIEATKAPLDLLSHAGC